MTAPFDQLHRAYIESRVQEWGLPPQDVETWLRSPGYRRDVEAIVRAVTEAGYVIVPREPTPAMLLAAADSVWKFSPDYAPSERGKFENEDSAEYVAGEAWRAMIAAATA